MVDPGANVNLISLQVIPAQYRDRIEKYDGSVYGIGGGQDAIGLIVADFTLGDAVFKSVQFVVCDNPKCPTLIGQGIWNHVSLFDLRFDQREKVIEFQLEHRDIRRSTK